jgi:hypothetical protein
MRPRAPSAIHHEYRKRGVALAIRLATPQLITEKLM